MLYPFELGSHTYVPDLTPTRSRYINILGLDPRIIWLLLNVLQCIYGFCLFVNNVIEEGILPLLRLFFPSFLLNGSYDDKSSTLEDTREVEIRRTVKVL